MSQNSDPKVLAGPVGYHTTSHFTTSSQPQGDPSTSPSNIATQSPGVVLLCTKGYSRLGNNRPYNDSSALNHLGSTVRPAVFRPSKTVKGDRQKMPIIKSDDKTTKSQQPDHYVFEDNQQQATKKSRHSTPAEILTKTSVIPQHPGQNRVLFHGSRCHPRAHASFARPSPSFGSNETQGPTTPIIPTAPVFPGMVSKKRQPAYFNPPYTCFSALPPDVQATTLNYLEGEPATDWPHELGLPMMDMLQHLRCCVLMFSEHENPMLRAVLRDPVVYARFRNGLNPNFLAPDGGFVRSIRAQCPCLDSRLKISSQRWRIVWAFWTIDFPAVVGDMSDGGDLEMHM